MTKFNIITIYIFHELAVIKKNGHVNRKKDQRRKYDF